MGIEKIIRRVIEEQEATRKARKPRVPRNRRIILEDNRTAGQWVHDERKCKKCLYPLAISWPLSYCKDCWEMYKFAKGE